MNTASEWRGNPQEIRLNLFLIDVPHVEKYAVAETIYLTPLQAVDKGDGAVYEKDDPLIIHVSSEIDCYIAVINIDTTGGVHMLFPSRHEPDNFIGANKSRQIPSPDQGHYDLGISDPLGLETIQVFASKTPFPVEETLRRVKSHSRRSPTIPKRV